MDDQTWSVLLSDAAEAFDDATLKRGYSYYQQGRVDALRADGDRTLRATVTGGEYYPVTIDLDFLGGSTCMCPVNGYCKHMAAVLMAYAAQEGRSVHALANAATAAGLEKPTSSAGRGRGGKPAAYEKQEPRPDASFLATADVSKWREWFRGNANTIADMNRNPIFVKQALALFKKEEPPLEAGLAQVFRLNARLYLLERLFAPVGHTSSYFLGYYSQLAIADLTEELGAMLNAPLGGERSETMRQRLEETLGFLRAGMLRKSQASETYGGLYDKLWNGWLREDENGPSAARAYDRELTRLEEEKAGLGDGYDAFYGAMATARLQYYAGRDEEALAALGGASRYRNNRSGTALGIMYELMRGGEWDRLRRWLLGTAEVLETEHGGQEAYFGIWDELIRHRPDAEAGMWDTIAGMLPASGSFYEAKLHEYGRLDDWLDYHMSIGTDPLELRATELSPAETKAPDMLLAYYHQGVERYVLLRNRDGYKAAVKLLKRLAKLYKKLKRVDRWDGFFASFAERHSRLRALQEELKKGKLTL